MDANDKHLAMCRRYEARVRHWARYHLPDDQRELGFPSAEPKTTHESRLATVLWSSPQVYRMGVLIHFWLLEVDPELADYFGRKPIKLLRRINAGEEI